MTALAGCAPGPGCVCFLTFPSGLEEQLPASGRPGGSRLGALVVLGRRTQGTRRKAVAWYWGVVDA